jgi:hypothetical protein
MTHEPSRPPATVFNLEAMRAHGWTAVDLERLEHLEAVADTLVHLARIGIVELRDQELRDHLVALNLLAEGEAQPAPVFRLGPNPVEPAP